VKLSNTLKKLLTLATTTAITLYLLYKVHSEASEIHLSPERLLSPYFFGALTSGLLGYLTYTLVWYIYIKNVADVTYRRVLLTNLAGTYLSFSLNPTLGTLVKVKFIGASYWDILATTVLGIITEFTAGLTLITLLGGEFWGIILAGIIFLPVIFDEWTYRILMPIFHLVHREKILEGLHSGWKSAKAHPQTLPLAMVLGTALVILNSTTLYLVARTFGFNPGFLTTLKGILYSNFLGGALGTPGGVGANELGVVMAIGRSGRDVVVAFLYKLINQYIYALIGAVAFYKFVLGEIGEDSRDVTDKDPGEGYARQDHRRN